MDNQNIWLFLGTALIIGTLIFYTDKRIYLPVLTVFFLTSFATLYPKVGKKVGEMLFMQKDATLKNSKFTFKGEILYIGRKKIYFFDKELNKMIELNKAEIVQKNSTIK